MLQCGCDFSSPVSLFEAVQVARRDTDLFGSLELGKSELLPPGLELISQGFRARQAAFRKRLIAGQALIRLANNVWWFNENGRLEPVLCPAALTYETLVPPVILPGSNHTILQQGIESFLETRACFGRLAFIDVHTDSIEEGHHPKWLQSVSCVCFAAPLITQIPDQPFFPRLPIGVIVQRLGREQSCLTPGTKEEMCEDFPGTENKERSV
jgi:hypothetical protein